MAELIFQVIFYYIIICIFILFIYYIVPNAAVSTHFGKFLDT